MSMKAITLVVALILSLTLAPLAEAQPAKVARIGFLAPTSASSNPERVEALWAGLRDLGYVEGKNIVIEFRWARESSIGSPTWPRSSFASRLTSS